MGIMNVFKKKEEAHAGMVIGLTSLGKAKAENFSLDGPRFQIISYLNDSGPSSLREVSENTKIPVEKVKALAKQLAREGYVRRTSSDDAGAGS